MKRRLTLLAVLALLLCVCPAALAQETVTDFLGREVAVSGSERIVSLTPSNTEILYALGVGERVVGVDSYSNYPAEALENAQVVGDYYAPNMELIVSLAPDLVLAGNNLQGETVAQLEQLGLTVLAAEASSYAQIAQSIDMIAAATGADGAPLIAQMESRLAAIQESVQGKANVRLYYAVGYGEWGDYSIGPGSFIYELLSLLPVTLVTADAPVLWPSYTLEEIVMRDPEAVVIGGTQDMAEEFKTLPGYAELSASQNDRVYAVDADTISRPAPRVLDALAEIAGLLFEE